MVTAGGSGRCRPLATLAELRDYVRVQTETTASELPDSTINSYLREAFNRTLGAENRWPFYEESWLLTQGIGQATITLPGDVNTSSIVSLTDDLSGRRLTLTDHETAEDNYSSASVASGRPMHFSLWGRVITLWPHLTPTTPQTYSLRGYRLPVDWVSLGPSSPPDADDRLHWPLAHYAIALAYLQQEDEVLEATYMARWQRDVEVARRSIMEPARPSPMQMGGGKWRWNTRREGWWWA